ATLIVGWHETALIDGYADFLEADALAPRAHPDRNQHLVTVDVLRAVGRRDGDCDGAVGVFLQTLGLCLREHLAATFGDVTLDQANRLGIHPWQEARGQLDDGQL